MGLGSGGGCIGLPERGLPNQPKQKHEYGCGSGCHPRETVLELAPGSPAPFAGRHAEALLEHGVEQPQVPIAAFVGNTDDLGVGLLQQLLGAEQTGLRLPNPERDTELVMEEPAQVTLAALQMASEFAKGTCR